MDKINAANVNATSAQSSGIDMSKVKRALFIVEQVAGTGSISGVLQSSPNANFSPAHNISGTNITNTNAAGVTSTTEVRAEYVQQQNPGDRYVRINITTSANLNAMVYGFGGESEQKPASQYNLNTATLIGQVVN